MNATPFPTQAQVNITQHLVSFQTHKVAPVVQQGVQSIPLPHWSTVVQIPEETMIKQPPGWLKHHLISLFSALLLLVYSTALLLLIDHPLPSCYGETSTRNSPVLSPMLAAFVLGESLSPQPGWLTSAAFAPYAKSLVFCFLKGTYLPLVVEMLQPHRYIKAMSTRQIIAA